MVVVVTMVATGRIPVDGLPVAVVFVGADVHWADVVWMTECPAV